MLTTEQEGLSGGPKTEANVLTFRYRRLSLKMSFLFFEPIEKAI
jgi:hypothetical protein